MSGRKPAREGVGGAAHPPPPPPLWGGAGHPRQQCEMKTLTLDGSLFDAPATGRPVGGNPKRPVAQAGTLTGSGSKPRAKPRLPPAGAVLLDNGEAESAFIDTLRSHYTRNGTAESFTPNFSKTPTKTYARNGRGGAAGGSAAAARQPGGLAQQERALWEEREEELVDAQERRFAQMEDALAARESKREAYLVHRLEATAAKKIEEHRRVQEAAARARELAVQRVQQLPSLQKARSAAQPASPTAAALQKLARGPPCAASPGLAAAQQAVAGVSSIAALSTLHAGLESGLDIGAAAVGAGAPLLGAGRLGWEGKQRQAAAKAVDQVYDQIQAAKTAGAPPLSPLDAAKDATRLNPVGGSRRGSGQGTRTAAGQHAGGAATASCDGTEAEAAVNLPRSRAASSLGSGASLTDDEAGQDEGADGPVGTSLDAACQAGQPLAAATCQPVNDLEEQSTVPASGCEEGGAEEAAQPDEAAGGGASFSGGRPSGVGEPERQPHAAAVADEASSASQPDCFGIQPSTSKPEEASGGGCGGIRCSAGPQEGRECSMAGPPAADEEPVAAAMLAAAVAADTPAAAAGADVPADAAAAAAEEPVVTAAMLAAEAEAAVPVPPLEAAAVAQAGADASLPPDAGRVLAAEQAPVSADHDSEGTAVCLVAAAAAEVSATAAESAPLGEPSAGGASPEPSQLGPQPALLEPEAAAAAVPPAVACQQDVVTAAAAVQLVAVAVVQPACGAGEQAAVSCGADEARLVTEADEQAALAGATEDLAEGEVPAEAPAAGSSEQQTAAVTGDGSEQPRPSSMEAVVAVVPALEPGREGAEAAAEPPVVVVQEPEAATAGLPEEQRALPSLSAGVQGPAVGDEAAEGLVAAPAGTPAAEPGCGGLQAGPDASRPAQPAEAAAVEASAVLQGQASEQRAAGMATADSAEAVGLTQRASASLLFGGRSADGPGVDGGVEEGAAQQVEFGGNDAASQAAEAVGSCGMDPLAVPHGSTDGEGVSGAASPAGSQAGEP